MTRFYHQQRNGRRKKAKPRRKRGLGIEGDPQRLLVHRELAALRNPSKKRFRKLRAALSLAKSSEEN